MKNTFHTAKIMIAALPGTCKNYELALINSGFQTSYPPRSVTGSPFLLSKLNENDFDLLLLPGGGDISPLLYTNPPDTSPPAIAGLQDATGASNCLPPDYVTDLLQFQLLQLALLRKKPVLGICKGMQLLNVWFGGDLYPHLPTADAHCADTGDILHPLFFPPHLSEHCHIFGCDHNTFSALYALLVGTPLVNSAHHQGVHRLGEDMLTLQYSRDFLPETIAHRHLPILGLQWHPERLPAFRDNDFKKLIQLLLKSSTL